MNASVKTEAENSTDSFVLFLLVDLHWITNGCFWLLTHSVRYRFTLRRWNRWKVTWELSSQIHTHGLVYLSLVYQSVVYQGVVYQGVCSKPDKSKDKWRWRKLCICAWVTRFVPKTVPIAPKWDKSGAFSDQISVDLAPIWGQSDPFCVQIWWPRHRYTASVNAICPLICPA